MFKVRHCNCVSSICEPTITPEWIQVTLDILTKNNWSKMSPSKLISMLNAACSCILLKFTMRKYQSVVTLHTFVQLKAIINRIQKKYS